MYTLEISNFFYLNSRIAKVRFWMLGFMNSISNINWLILRFFSINRYELSFFLFKSKSLYNIYTNISFTNRCVAIFSKLYKYFFTTNIFEDDSFLLENSLSNIQITNVGFFFKNKLYFLSCLHYYKNKNSLSLFKPLIPLFEKPYLYIVKYFFNIFTHFFFFLYFKSFLIKHYFFIYLKNYFVKNGYY